MPTGQPVGTRALVLQHQHNAPPALLSDWARARAVELVVVRADRARELPAPDGFAFVITLGSDHSAGHRRPPWVERELDWIRTAHRAELPILGICFGAQALAVALGGSVHRETRPEIGWISVESAAPEIVADGPWFAWHEDVFDPPDGAAVVARNAFGPRRSWPARIWGCSSTQRSPPRWPRCGVRGRAASAGWRSQASTSGGSCTRALATSSARRWRASACSTRSPRAPHLNPGACRHQPCQAPLTPST